MIGSTLVLSGEEVDAPAADAIYLISIGAAVQMEGGKGTSNINVEAKEPEEVEKQVTAAISKMVKKRKEV